MKIIKKLMIFAALLFSVVSAGAANNNCADDFCQVAGFLTYEVKAGETQSNNWGLIWNGNGQYTFDITILGNNSVYGSDFKGYDAKDFVKSDRFVTINSGEVKYVNVSVVIPKDTPSGDYYAEISAKMRATGSGNVQVEKQMTKPIKIKVLGENNSTSNDIQVQSGGELKTDNEGGIPTQYLIGGGITVGALVILAILFL